MAVDENGRFTGGVQPVGVDERVALCIDEADVFHADALEFGDEEFGGAAAVAFVLGQSRDGWNAQEVFEFIEKTCVIFCCETYSGRRHEYRSSNAGCCSQRRV